MQTQVLRRNLNSRDRSWAIQTNLATRIAAKDRSQGETFLLQQFDYFGKSITLLIYYDNKLVKKLTFDPLATKKKAL